MPKIINLDNVTVENITYVNVPSIPVIGTNATITSARDKQDDNLATTGEDAGWNWKFVPLGDMEYCWCSCSLTRGELKFLELALGQEHSESMIEQARIKRDQKARTITGSGFRFI